MVIYILVTMLSCLTSAGDSTVRCGNGTWVCRLCYVQIPVGGLGISSIGEEDLSHGRSFSKHLCKGFQIRLLDLDAFFSTMIGSNVGLSVITGVTIVVSTSSSGSARMLLLAVRTVHLL